MAIGETLFGSSERTEQYPRFNPRQMKAINQFLNQAQGGLTGLINRSPVTGGKAPGLPSAQVPQAQVPQPNYQGFNDIANYATSQFQKGIPSLAERFTNSGTKLGSSAFAGQLGAAQSGLAEYLGALRSQYGLQNQQLQQHQQQIGQNQQQIGQRQQQLGQNQQQLQLGERANLAALLQNLLGYGFQSPYDTRIIGAQPGLAQNILPVLGQLGSAAIGGMFGGPVGAGLGYAGGGLLNNLLNPQPTGQYGNAYPNAGSFY